MKGQTAVIQGKGINKRDKELVEAILGGEMKNAWEPSNPGEGKDTRLQKGGSWNTHSRQYLNNYDRIFKSETS
jgi:hypothetical protein